MSGQRGSPWSFRPAWVRRGQVGGAGRDWSRRQFGISAFVKGGCRNVGGSMIFQWETELGRVLERTEGENA